MTLDAPSARLPGVADFYGGDLELPSAGGTAFRVGSELGLVGDPPALATALRERLGLAIWSGTVDEPGALAFVGEQARTFILAPPGRGWLPTGRPSERHPVDAVIEGCVVGAVSLDSYRVTATAGPAR